MELSELKRMLVGGLIVSCQALPGEAMYTQEGNIMPLFAAAAKKAGAVGIQASGERDIRQIKALVDLPLIGFVNRSYPGTEKYITVTMCEVNEVVRAGADIVAIDCTDRPGFEGQGPETFLTEIRTDFPGLSIMAEIATLEEARHAIELGVDWISTSMFGYTEETMGAPAPNFQLVEQLVALGGAPVIAKGRIHTPEDARRMLELGAHSVVVGGAITRPYEITRRFVEGMQIGRES